MLGCDSRMVRSRISSRACIIRSAFDKILGIHDWCHMWLPRTCALRKGHRPLLQVTDVAMQMQIVLEHLHQSGYQRAPRPPWHVSRLVLVCQLRAHVPSAALFIRSSCGSLGLSGSDALQGGLQHSSAVLLILAARQQIFHSRTAQQAQLLEGLHQSAATVRECTAGPE